MLKYTIEYREIKIKSVGGKVVNIIKQATFKIYFENFNRKGYLTLIKFTKGGQVINELELNILFGNDFLYLYRININYRTEIIIFKNFNNFYIDFVIQVNFKVYIGRVIIIKKITLLLG